MHQHRQRRSNTSGITERPALKGQHLLHHEPLIHDMIDMARVTPADTVLDIGAGRGAITFPLAKKAGRVLAIENDAVFAATLRQKAVPGSNVTVIEKDIREAYFPKVPFHVVANIPFFMTTLILEKLLDPPGSAFQGAVLIVQHGAAKGFTARQIRSPRLLKWRMWFDFELVKVVPRRHFSPPPQVDAAVLRIRRRKTPWVETRHHHAFGGLAEYAMDDPARPVCEALSGIFTPVQIRHLLQQIRVDRNTPVCLLRERDWAAILDTMREKVPSYRWPKAPTKKKSAR